MAVYGEYDLISSAPLAPDIHDITVYCPDIAKAAKAGQFAQIYINRADLLLPRPISFCDVYGDTARFVFRVLGQGTSWLSHIKPGRKIRMTAPLGNGFPLTNMPRVAIVGGGLGVPPLLFLAKQLIANMPERVIKIFLGFSGMPFICDDFALGSGADNIRPYIATIDGLEGIRGTAVDLLNAAGNFDVIYACGPRPMMQAVHIAAKAMGARLFVSMEERMACGVGACAGCAVKIRAGGNNSGYIYKRVCADGPVFDGDEVFW